MMRRAAKTSRVALSCKNELATKKHKNDLVNVETNLRAELSKSLFNKLLNYGKCLRRVSRFKLLGNTVPRYY